MKKIILLLTLALIPVIGCDIEYGTAEQEIGAIYDYDFENDIPEFATIEDAMKWVDKYLKSQNPPEKEDYWQTPEESFYAQNGDCEDHCILFMYILKKQFNLKSKICILHQLMGYHAVVYVDLLEEYYDVANNKIHPKPELAKKQTERQYTYSETLWIAINLHTDIYL